MKKKVREILRPVLEKLEDSSEALYRDARAAVWGAIKQVDPDSNLYRQGDGSLHEYFNRQITYTLIDLIRHHENAVTPPHSGTSLEDFIDDALARYGSPQSQMRVRETNEKRKK